MQRPMVDFEQGDYVLVPQAAVQGQLPVQRRRLGRGGPAPATQALCQVERNPGSSHCWASDARRFKFAWALPKGRLHWGFWANWGLAKPASGRNAGPPASEPTLEVLSRPAKAQDEQNKMKHTDARRKWRGGRRGDDKEPKRGEQTRHRKPADKNCRHLTPAPMKSRAQSGTPATTATDRRRRRALSHQDVPRRWESTRDQGGGGEKARARCQHCRHLNAWLQPSGDAPV